MARVSNIILVGVIWGFVEATLGGALHLFQTPLVGRVMASVGFAILFWGMRNGLKNSDLICAAAIAASFKFLDAWMFHMPITHITIINPAQSIMMQGLAFVGATYVARKVANEWLNIAVLAAVAMPLSIVLFNVVSYFAIGYQSTGHLQNILQTIYLKAPMGILMTAGLMFALKIAMEKIGTLDISHLKTTARLGTATVLGLAAVVVRSFF